MKNKNIFKILFFMVVVISTIVFMRWNSEFNKNNRYLLDKLLNGASDTSGTVGELFDFDYDKLYVFEPYQSKDEMEKQIGFKSRVLQETVSENMINILFVKDDAPVAYLYGYGSNNGYYVELPTGSYSKSEMQEIRYKVITNEVGNSSGTKKTYLNYILDMNNGPAKLAPKCNDGPVTYKMAWLLGYAMMTMGRGVPLVARILHNV